MFRPRRSLTAVKYAYGRWCVITSILLNGNVVDRSCREATVCWFIYVGVCWSAPLQPCRRAWHPKGDAGHWVSFLRQTVNEGWLYSEKSSVYSSTRDYPFPSFANTLLTKCPSSIHSVYSQLSLKQSNHKFKHLYWGKIRCNIDLA